MILRGSADIFEAQTVHAAALQALTDNGAAAIRLDSTNVQRLDLSALQILAALRRDLETAGRKLPLSGSEVIAAAARAGLIFCGQD